ncbi:MAG: substrate-binding domain-containing protein [Campylobacteraceae bacterium]
MQKLKNIIKILLTNMYTITLVYLSLVAHLAGFLAVLLTAFLGKLSFRISEDTMFIFAFFLSILASFLFGILIGKKIKSNNFFLTYFPPLFISGILLIVWNVAFFISKGDITRDIFMVPFTLSLNFFMFAIAAIFAKITILLYFVIGSYLTFAIGFHLGFKKQNRELGYKKFLHVNVAVILVLVFALSFQIYKREEFLISTATSREQASVERVDTYDYKPFTKSLKITPLREKSKLFFEDDFPIIDGATALYPIYASAVESIYKAQNNPYDLDEIVTSTKTPNAYKRLIDGEVELIFALEPSSKQKEYAKEKGVEFIFTPLGKDAFVFFTNKENEIKNLTIKNIQDIYSGKIKNWSEVGGDNKNILAFQRPENSGSQTTMLALVMKDIEMKKPLREEFHAGMGGIVNQVADYRNAKNAIGYSFKFYVTSMLNAGNINLLSIDNIEPTVENIQNETYPFTTTFYIVSTNKTSKNGNKLIDWFKSEQGQQLIKDVGYVPVLHVK